MISYQTTERGLESLIERKSPGWTKRAGARTTKFRQQGFYRERGSIWSEVKPVYMLLQGESKCAFCERKLESETYGKGEQAVEHFRPKGKVKEWKPRGTFKNKKIPFAKVPVGNRGYYLLAYHRFNYTAACNPCNSVLKGSYFPIAGKYAFRSDDVSSLRKELPYLIYPIGPLDRPAESVIEYYGVTPRAVAHSGHILNRALVTIEIFLLDDPIGRKNLFRERAMVIALLYTQLETIAKTDDRAEKEEARKLVGATTSEKAPHTNCAASFIKLYKSNPAEAKTISNSAMEFICSTS